ncbi:aldehyde dehydrogenase family protein, partial [Bacillus sp. HC-Mk]
MEDEIPDNLEFVQGSERAEGAEPNPVELKVENGKVIAKYPEITDTKERSIAFKVKVKEEAKAGETIVNKAVVSEPNGQTEHPEEKITPDYKYGKVDVEKSVTNQTPKLGEEVEYRITFYNTVENGKLEKVLVEDTLPKGVEYVKDSLKAEGIKPEPVELKVEDGKVMAKYPEITDTEKRSIVFKVKVKDSAKAAFETWSKVPVPNRSRNLYKYLQLLQENKDELAKIITLENGKTLTDATGEVQRGIEAVELATSTPNLMMGQALPNIASGIDGSIWRYPIGVVAGITPFNFPMMIPLWMFPLAIACGNTFVLKTSERTPLLAERLVELFYEAGFPKGVLNLVQGGKDVVNSILENKDIQAVSFVGSE